MILPILAGGAAAGGAYWLMNKLGKKDEVDPYKPDQAKFEYGGLGEKDYFAQRAEAAGRRDAPQADMSKYEGGRTAQMEGRADQGLASSYYKSMINNPNSFAQHQLRQASDANFRQQLAAGRSAGYNPAAMRAAMQTGGQINAQTNQQAQGLQLQETQMAVQGLAQSAMQQRAQDLQLMGMDAQTAQYQAMLELQQGALNDKMQLGMYQLGQNASMAQLQAGMGYEGQLGGNIMAAQGANAQANAAEQGAMWGMIGTGASAGATYAAGQQSQPGKPPPPSDERSKQKIETIQAENSGLRRLLSSLAPAPATPPKQGVRHQQLPGEGRTSAEYRGQYFTDDRSPIESSEYNEIRDEADVVQAESEIRRHNAEALRQQAIAEMRQQQDIAQQKAHLERIKARERSIPAEAAAAMGPAPAPSDERSKQRIQELEGIVTEYRSMLGGVGQSQAPRPDLRTPGEPPTARFADVAPTAAAMAELPSKQWEYREPFASQYPGTHLGPTAQDLEANPATAGTTYTGEDGLKRPDPTLLSLQTAQATAEMARLQQAQDDALKQYRELERLPRFTRPEVRR